MLTGNISRIIFTLSLELTFDDGTSKVGVINENDYLLLKFRYDGNKLIRACKVIAIQPVILYTQPESYTGALMIDCSGEFYADRLKVVAKDILDFRIVDKKFIDDLAPDYDITDDLFDPENDPVYPSIPEEKYEIAAAETAGIGKARILR